MAVEREEGAIEVAGDGLGFTVSEDVDALGERFFRVSVGGVVVLGEAGGTGIEADVAPAGVLGFLDRLSQGRSKRSPLQCNVPGR